MQFKCLCEKYECSIGIGEKTVPCPHCGRVYVCQYEIKQVDRVKPEKDKEEK